MIYFTSIFFHLFLKKITPKFLESVFLTLTFTISMPTWLLDFPLVCYWAGFATVHLLFMAFSPVQDWPGFSYDLFPFLYMVFLWDEPWRCPTALWASEQQLNNDLHRANLVNISSKCAHQWLDFNIYTGVQVSVSSKRCHDRFPPTSVQLHTGMWQSCLQYLTSGKTT